MNNLLNKEEQDLEIKRIKVSLISLYYPFSKEEILKYKNALYFNDEYIMGNESIFWDIDLVEKLKDKIDWQCLYKVKNIKLDIHFFRQFWMYIDFHLIIYSQNIEWSEELINEFGEKFDWSKWLISKEPLSNIKNLRQFKDKLDWGFVSQRIKIDFNENILEEFADKWDWKKLSLNKNLPLNVEFIKKHIDQLDFDELSKNPACLKIIKKYPTSEKWNWEKVILNPAIEYNKESFDFFYFYFKKQFDSKPHTDSKTINLSLYYFLLIISNIQSDKSYFLSDEFIKFIPKKNLHKFCDGKLTLTFIEKYKEFLNFRDAKFIENNEEIIGFREFKRNNLELFNSDNWGLVSVSSTKKYLDKFDTKTNWFKISSATNIFWTWAFIIENYDKLNITQIKKNKRIFDYLIKLYDKNILSVFDVPKGN